MVDQQDGTTSHINDITMEEMRRREFAEEFGLYWEQAGSPRMDGRILGYLLIMSEPYISSTDLAEVLSASAGSVSMATRRMVESGFVKRHVVRGDRNHYFRADDDPWGSFLAGERNYLKRQREMLEHALRIVPESDQGSRKRLVTSVEYMRWLTRYHRKMLADWEAYKQTIGIDEHHDTTSKTDSSAAI